MPLHSLKRKSRSRQYFEKEQHKGKSGLFLIKKSSPAVVEKETPQNISKRKEKEKKSSTKTYIYKTGKTQFCRTPHCRRYLLNTPFLPTNSFRERREPAAVLSARQTANPPSAATAQDQTSSRSETAQTLQRGRSLGAENQHLGCSQQKPYRVRKNRKAAVYFS